MYFNSRNAILLGKTISIIEYIVTKNPQYFNNYFAYFILINRLNNFNSK